MRFWIYPQDQQAPADLAAAASVGIDQTVTLAKEVFPTTAVRAQFVQLYDELSGYSISDADYAKEGNAFLSANCQ